MRAFIVRFALAALLTVSGWAATGAPFAGQVFQGISDPRSLPSLAAWYDVSDVSSMLVSVGVNPTNGQAVKLLSDKSGNSAVNVLALNGVVGNSATVPDTAASSPTTAIDLALRISMADWTPSAAESLAGKWNVVGNQRSYSFNIAIGGALVFIRSTDGSSGTLATATSSVATGIADFATAWIRVTHDAASGDTKFYTAADSSTVPSSWTQLGTTQTITAGNIFDSTDTAGVGKGNTAGGNLFNIYRWIVSNSIGGVAAIDANFALPAKLATSFTESSSNAATVTINTSGATGARISGARDLYQGTAANQPILTIAATGNYLTFDGSNDSMKAAAWAMAQPISIYGVISQVTWTDQDRILDGNSNNSVALWQQGSTPIIRTYAGAADANIDNGGLAVATRGIFTAIINGASSSARVNRGTATTGSIGTAAMNGLTLGARADGAQSANITASEILIYNAAHATATQDSVIGYLARHWSISGGFAYNPPSEHGPIMAPIVPFPVAPWRREDELVAA